MFNTALLHNLREKLINSSIDDTIYDAAYRANEWFDRDNIDDSLRAVIEGLLSSTTIDNFAKGYTPTPCAKKSVTIVMAGNIPFVGCADLLYALLCDYGKIFVKLSSKDYVTMNYLIEKIKECDEYKNNIEFYANQSSDRLIATGSDNSGRYFRHNFNTKEMLIRSNRSSIAVVKEGYSIDQINSLWNDIFLRYGLGCRNITQIFVPKGFDCNTFKEAWNDKKIDSSHYHNNYKQRRALLKMGNEEFIDLDYAVMVESNSLFSQLSVVNYCYYDSYKQVENFISNNRESLQCTLFSDKDFGSAQFPSLFDYADGVDVMKFLL